MIINSKRYNISTLKVLETNGSRENASLMEKGQIDFAFMQNDVAYLIVQVFGVKHQPVHVEQPRADEGVGGWTVDQARARLLQPVAFAGAVAPEVERIRAHTAVDRARNRRAVCKCEAVGAVAADDLKRQWVQGTGPAAKPNTPVKKSIRNVAYALLSGLVLPAQRALLMLGLTRWGTTGLGW